MRLLNLTAHAVRVLDAGDVVLALEPTGVTARVQDDVSASGTFIEADSAAGPVPVRLVTPGRVVAGLPDAREGVGLVVSRITALARPERRDLFFPFDEVRGPDGSVVGCTALGQVAARDEA